MTPFTLCTYCPGKPKPPHSFFLLSKGTNAGRPSRTPNRNAFVCSCADAEATERMFWLCYSLWTGGHFRGELIGSVVLFIRKAELIDIIAKADRQLPAGSDLPQLMNQLLTHEQRLEKQLTELRYLKKLALKLKLQQSTASLK